MLKKYNFISFPYMVDRKLYKYYSNIEYAIDCIRNRRIHLDSPLAFNDPFDSAFNCGRLSFLMSSKSDRELAQEFLGYLTAIKRYGYVKHYQEILSRYVDFLVKSGEKLSNISTKCSVKSVMEKLYDLMCSQKFTLDDFINAIDYGYIEERRIMKLNCRISCFSEVYNSILMWSYYANSHKGICIEFDLSLLNQDLEETQQILKAISRVHYTPVRSDLLYFKNDTSALNFLVSKSDVWSHEHEWRLICDSDEEYLPFDCISGVYLGTNFDTSDLKYKKLISAVNSHESLSVKRCKPSLDYYQIECDEIYNSYISNFITDQNNKKKLWISILKLYHLKMQDISRRKGIKKYV